MLADTKQYSYYSMVQVYRYMIRCFTSILVHRDSEKSMYPKIRQSRLELIHVLKARRCSELAKNLLTHFVKGLDYIEEKRGCILNTNAHEMIDKEFYEIAFMDFISGL